MSVFWQKWLVLWSVIIMMFGLVLAGAGFAATDAMTRLIWQLFGAPTLAMDSNHRFAIGLMGAVTMGWGATLFVTFRALFWLDRDAAAPQWRLLTLVVLGWYGIDSVLSIATGIPMNAVSNTLLLVLYLIPILATGALTRQVAARA